MRAAYNKHIRTLAEKLGCKTFLAPNRDGMMYVEHGFITGPLISEYQSDKYPNLQSKYFTVLHELGHFFHGHTQGREPHIKRTRYFDNGVLKSECEAWRFAIDNCIDVLQPETRLFAMLCLRSYMDGAKAANGEPSRLSNGGRGGVQFRYDRPSRFIVDTFDVLGGDVEWLLEGYNEPGVGRAHADLMLFAVPGKKTHETRKIRGMIIRRGTFDGVDDWECTPEQELQRERNKKILRLVPLALRERRGRKLLKRFCTPKQWEEYRNEGRLTVTTRGTKFQLGGYLGVKEFNDDGVAVYSYCIHGRNAELPQSDVILAQKLLLEVDYDEFMRTANKRLTDSHPESVRMYQQMVQRNTINYITGGTSVYYTVPMPMVGQGIGTTTGYTTTGNFGINNIFSMIGSNVTLTWNEVIPLNEVAGEQG